MQKKLFKGRIFRFIVCGVITAAFNVLIIALIIEFLQLDQPFLRNIANVISIEVSVLFSFFVYRTWVWSTGSWKFQEILWRQIPLFHLSCGVAVATRSLVLFPLLNWLGVNYIINTLIGIVIGSSINYILSDQWTFKAK